MPEGTFKEIAETIPKEYAEEVVEGIGLCFFKRMGQGIGRGVAWKASKKLLEKILKINYRRFFQRKFLVPKQFYIKTQRNYEAI